jgi:PAS domain S-box-containing protein
VAVWRRGERRKAVLLGGSATIFMVGGTLQIIIVLWGFADIPFTMSLFFILMLGVVAYELTNDIFRAERLAEDLNDSEERLGLVLEVAGAGVWSWDYESGRIWATPQARMLYGLSPTEEVTFDRFLATVHPDDREAIRRSALEALHRGTGYHAEYRVVLPYGETRWMRVQSRAQLKPSGAPDRMMGVSIDISQHKQSEGETSRLRLELAHLSRVMVMNQLSTSLAHEINQPLGAILNNATAGSLMIRKAGLNVQEIEEILADIAQDARRAGDVIRKIRGIVKKGDVQLEYLHLNPLVEDVVALLHASIVMSRVTLELDLAADLPRIRADRVQLQQVLVNLITNAIDAMRNESVRELRIRTAAGPLGTVTASVGDTGSGIDSATASRLFEAFYTTKKDGLGMGLGICRSILQDHGGRIWAENKAQKGATFTFSLTSAAGDSP